MKTKSLSVLQKEAQHYLKKYGVNKVYVTADGQIFLLESRAKMHAGKDGKIYIVEKADEDIPKESQKADTSAPKAAKEIIASLSEITDVETIRQMLNDEVGSANRKSVVSAIEKRLEGLANEQ